MVRVEILEMRKTAKRGGGCASPTAKESLR
jgi:hypothetical protein